MINRKHRYFSEHSVVVLKTTVFLILSGAALFALLEIENPGTLGNASFGEGILISLFQSVTLRTAGFSSVVIGRCTRPMLLIMCFYMLIGGSPGGTAGGVKTTTVVVLFKTALNSLDNKHQDALIQHRRISPDLLKHALMIMSLYTGIIFLATMILTITEPGIDLLALMFEVFSAIATVGISTGITSSLSIIGKIMIMILMFIGRLGPLSLYLAFHKEKKVTAHVTYPDANIVIG